jgi:ABC-type dipeptide/oligopeptide/nickel transport system permease subunit
MLSRLICAVMLTGLAFSLLGDGLADALELPR